MQGRLTPRLGALVHHSRSEGAACILFALEPPVTTLSTPEVAVRRTWWMQTIPRLLPCNGLSLPANPGLAHNLAVSPLQIKGPTAPQTAGNRPSSKNHCGSSKTMAASSDLPQRLQLRGIRCPASPHRAGGCRHERCAIGIYSRHASLVTEQNVRLRCS